MKNLLYLILFALLGQDLLAQTTIGRQVVDSFTVSFNGPQKRYALEWFPPGYQTDGLKHPVIFFFHGAGDGGTGIAGLNNLLHTGLLTQRIAQGFNPAAIDPRTRQLTQFIVISPSDPGGWSCLYDQLRDIVPSALTKFAQYVDLNRVYITGLSAGGDGTLTCLGADTTFCKRFAAAALFSTADVDGSQSVPISDVQTVANFSKVISHNKVGVWFTCGDQDQRSNLKYNDSINNPNPSPLAKLSILANTGHSAWIQGYDSSWRPLVGSYYGKAASTVNGGNGPASIPSSTGQLPRGPGTGATQDSVNTFEWFLLFSRGASAPVTTPTANAGNNQTIVLPTSSVALNGSVTAGTGNTVNSTLWTEVSGPNTASIANASILSTTASGLILGTYVFQLKVTNNLGATATSTVTITVQSAPAPIANAGPDQTLTIPTTSTTLTGAASSGPITSYAWTQMTGPSTVSFGTPTAVTTTVSNLNIGIYGFKLTLNGGAAFAVVQVTVNAASTYPACGARTVHVWSTPNADTGRTLKMPEVLGYAPGDTIKIKGINDFANYWVYLAIDSFVGNPACPLIVVPYGDAPVLVQTLAGTADAQGFLNGHNGNFHISNSSYIKVDGKYAGLVYNNGYTYGFRVQGDPLLRYDLGAGFQVDGGSRNIEYRHCFAHNIGTGMWCKNDGTCDPRLNYPNLVNDSITIDSCVVIGTWNEGMYLLNTSPDNNASDPRPVVCNGVTTFPMPPRGGDFHIYGNYVDSCGRGGIQLGCASEGLFSEINNNIVKHCGMNGDDAQGTCISDGQYTKAKIHDNVCGKTYTWSIALLGASHTGFPQEVYNNQTDSSGYQATYDLSNTTKEVINPWTEPMFTDSLPWPQTFFFDSKPKQFQDSTILSIRNNIFGLAKGMSQQILIQNDAGDLQLRGGNIICNNVIKGTGVPCQIFVDPNATGFTFSSNCAGAPTVGAGSNQTITLPTSTATLTGFATANEGVISSVNWTKLSGPATFTITSPTSTTTTVTGLIQGQYVFQITAFDSLGLSSSASVTVNVAPPVIPAGTAGKVPISLRKKILPKH